MATLRFTILGCGSSGGVPRLGGVWGDCNGLTHNVVRYDSPTFAGFSVSASWGEDDMWDVAGRYAGEFSGFKIALAAAYTEITDSNYNNLTNALGAVIPDEQYFQAGGSGAGNKDFARGRRNG